MAALAACTTSARPDDPAYDLTGGKADSNWCHVNFDSVEGANIRVDYQIADSEPNDGAEYVQTANPVWLNVQRDDLASASSVLVWIGDETYIDPLGYQESLQYGEVHDNGGATTNLYRSEDATRFTSQVAAGLPISEAYEGDDVATLHAHQFAIEIDGNWQTDPISGVHNFLATYLGSCGN
ncbi:MAG TPA: hypothetical protein VMJ10_20760 [Kofleriaceae bacterium]|nr:hypothetical protein [Kofleriaceae bacterium]